MKLNRNDLVFTGLASDFDNIPEAVIDYMLDNIPEVTSINKRWKTLWVPYKSEDTKIYYWNFERIHITTINNSYFLGDV